jgi:hypothetical protein
VLLLRKRLRGALRRHRQVSPDGHVREPRLRHVRRPCVPRPEQRVQHRTAFFQWACYHTRPSYLDSASAWRWGVGCDPEGWTTLSKMPRTEEDMRRTLAEWDTAKVRQEEAASKKKRKKKKEMKKKKKTTVVAPGLDSEAARSGRAAAGGQADCGAARPS